MPLNKDWNRNKKKLETGFFFPIVIPRGMLDNTKIIPEIPLGNSAQCL